jgi:hypothetical protein
MFNWRKWAISLHNEIYSHWAHAFLLTATATNICALSGFNCESRRALFYVRTYCIMQRVQIFPPHQPSSTSILYINRARGEIAAGASRVIFFTRISSYLILTHTFACYMHAYNVSGIMLFVHHAPLHVDNKTTIRGFVRVYISVQEGRKQSDARRYWVLHYSLHSCSVYVGYG